MPFGAFAEYTEDNVLLRAVDMMIRVVQLRSPIFYDSDGIHVMYLRTFYNYTRVRDIVSEIQSKFFFFFSVHAAAL